MNRTGSTILHGLLLATSGLVGSTLIASTAAMAGGGPTGGSVAVGSATIINASPTQTVVNQASKKALINWNSFSIPGGSSVKFNQPTTKSLTVNRVTGPNASTIDGQLLANGNIWLINANGILFGKGSQINVGALLATTSDLSDDDFKAGKYNFKPAANSNAGVVNKGTITAGANGSVVLSAPRVSNEGLIHADFGTVVLGGAKAFTVDMTGDNLLRYEITAPVTSAPKDGNGSIAAALVSNSGAIEAAGGHVMMTARAARNVENNVINNTGMVEATSVSSHNGEIDLDAGTDGTVNDSGTLDASGKASGETGGAVNVTGGTVNVQDGAKIDASGSAGGGTIQIGGGAHGGGTLAHATRTIIGKATIMADATDKGNGGNVAVWSDGSTTFDGSISAKGGKYGGNGGQVETSGHSLGVSSTAKVDASSADGLSGDWLLDPAAGNVTIDMCCGTCNTGEYDADTIQTSLNGGTQVTIEQASASPLGINVNGTISWSSSAALSLLSEGFINLNASIQNAGSGALNLIAGWDGHSGVDSSMNVDPTAITQPGAYGNAGGDITFSNGVAVGTGLGTTTVAGSNITMTSSGGVEQIGYAETSGNMSISGDIAILATGDFDLTGNGTVFIGNGDASAANIAANVAGNISITVAGDTELLVEGGTVKIGNSGSDGANGDNTGNLSLITGTLTESGASPLEDAIYSGLGGGDNSGGGGDVLIGIKTGDFALGAPFDYDATSIEYSSNHSLSVLSGGNLTVENSILNSGAGNITLVAGWDGTTTTFSSTMASSVYGQGSGSISIVSSDSDAISVGSAAGQILVAGYDIDLMAEGGATQIGYHGAGGGNIAVLAGGDLTLNGGEGVSNEAQIGNGDATGETSGNVTGDIFLNVAGRTSIDSYQYGEVYLGNTAAETSIETGNVTVLTNNGSFGGSFFTDDLGTSTGTGGNVFVGFTATSGSPNTFDMGDYQSANTFTLAAAASLDITSDVTNSGTGNVNVIAGWDGATTDLTALTNSDVAGATAYGNNSGTVTIESASVGAASGKTTVAGYSVTLDGSENDSQIGYSGVGGGDISVLSKTDVELDAGVEGGGFAQIGNNGYTTDTGNISVVALGNVTLSGGDVSNYAQIGNGGADGDDETTVSGDINVNAGGDLNLLSGANDFAYTQIGNGGDGTASDISGNIVVGVSGTITLTGSGDYAQIGNGGSEGGEDPTGNISVNATGAITLSGGDSDYAYAQIGNGGAETDAATGGNITVVSGGDLSLDGGEGSYAYAQIGNGGDSSTGTNSGDVAVDVTGSVDLEGDGDYAQIGNGGYGASDSSGNITVLSGDGLSLYGGGGDSSYSYAQIGNGGDSFAGINSGNIVVNVTGSINLEGGGDYAQIGNGGSEGVEDPTGNISVNATGAITLSGGDSDYAYAQIGNGGAAVAEDASGNITVMSGGDLSLDGGEGSYAYAQIGNGGDSFAGINSGNIVVNVTGSINLEGGGGDYAQIGNGGASTSGNNTGNVTVNAVGNVTLTGGAGQGDYTQIGNGGLNSNSSTGVNVTDSGNINVTASAVTLTAGNGTASYAQIGHGGAQSNTISGCITASDSGNIIVTALSGNITLTGGSGTANVTQAYAQIGDGGPFSGGANATQTGNITINAQAGSVVLTGGSDVDEQDGYALIGGSGTADKTGNITVMAGQNIVLTGGASTYDGIGHSFADIGNINGGSAGSNISVIAGGDLRLTAGSGTGGGAGDDARVGNNADSSTGNVTVNVTGTTSLTSATAGNAVYIGDAGSTVTGDLSVTTGDLDTSGDTLGDFQTMIGSDLTGGNVTLAFTDAVATAAITGVSNYTSAHDLEILSAGGLEIEGSIQNIGAGNITLVAGWDGTTVGDVAALESAHAYGSSASDTITIGGANAAGDVSVGSNGGTTTAFTGSLIVDAENGVAQLGTNGIGGDINVVATGDVTVTAAANRVSQIGNGGDTSAATGNSGGDIVILTGGGTVAVNSLGNNAIAEIGNMDAIGTTQSGNITINTNFVGDITLNSTGAGGFAQIGHGSTYGAATTGNITLDGTTISATGSGQADVTGDTLDITLPGNGGSVGSSADALSVAVNDLAIDPAAGVSNAYINSLQAISLGVGSTGIDLPGGAFVLHSDGAVTQTQSVVAASIDVETNSGDITLNNPLNAFNIATVQTGGTDGASLFDSSNLNVTLASIGGTLTLTGGGTIGQSGAIIADALSTSTTGGAITLLDVGNNVNTVSLSTSGTDSASFNDTVNMTVASADVGGTLTLTGDGTIGQSGVITASGLNAQAADSIGLAEATNAISGDVSFTTPGDISFTNSVATTIGSINGGSATLGAANVTITVDDGSLSQTGIITAGNLTVFTQDTSGPLNAYNIDLTGDNDVSGGITLFGTGNAFFTNTRDTTIQQISVDGAFDIQTNDDNEAAGSHSSITLGLQVSASANGGASALVASGDIIDTAGTTIDADSLYLKSSFGVIGTAADPIKISANAFGAKTTDQDIFVSSPLAALAIGTTNGGIDAGTGNVTLMAGGNISQGTGSDAAVTAGDLTVTASDTGGDVFDIGLTDASNDVTGTVSLTALGDLSFADTAAVTLGGANGGFNGSYDVTAGNVTIATTSGGINITGSVVGANVSLTAPGNIALAGGGLDGGNLTVASSGANISLLADNDFDGTVNITASGDAAFGNNDNTRLGAVSVGGDLTVLSEGNLTISSSIQNAGSGNITLVGGWDGSTTGAGLSQSGAYGNSGATDGNVTVGGGAFVAVGSKSGLTTIEGDNINVDSTGGAQIGYAGAGGGNIDILAVGNVVLGYAANGTTLLDQIGNGAALGVAGAGNITIDAGTLSTTSHGDIAGNTATITTTVGGIGEADNPLLVELINLGIPSVGPAIGGGDAYITSPNSGLNIGNGVNGLQLNGGNLTLIAAGDITQTSSILVNNATVTTSSGDIALTSGGNYIGGAKLSAQGDVSLYDFADLTAYGVTAGGDTTLASAGNLTVAASIQNPGDLTLVAGWDESTVGSAAALQSAAAYGAADTDTVFIGGAGATGGVAAGSTGGTTTVLTGALNLDAQNGYAQLGDHGAGTGTTNVVATGAVFLSGSSSNDYAQIGSGSSFAGGTAGNVTISSGTLDMAGASDIDGESADITVLAGAAGTSTDPLQISVGKLALATTNSDAVVFADGPLSIGVGSKGIDLGTGDLTLVNTDGAVTQVQKIAAGGITVDADNGAITLTNSGNTFANVSLWTNGTNASLTDSTGFDIIGADVGGATLTLTGGGAITQTNAIDAAGLIVVATNGVIALTGGNNVISNVTLSTNGTNDASLDDTTGLNVVGATVGGNLTLSANSITQTGAISADALNATATVGTVLLGNTGNAFNNATLSAVTNGTLFDADALTIAGATVGATLTLVSGGAINQTGAIAAGTLDATTTNGAITLTNTNNAVKTASFTTAGADNVSFADSENLTIGATNVGGMLTVSNDGSIKQNGAIAAQALVATATGGAITLTNTGNAISTASLSTTGSNDASLTDASSLTINSANVGGTLTLTSGGAIDQTGVINAGSLSATGSTIALTNANNQIGMAQLSATGDATLHDVSNLTILGATIGGNLTISDGGTIGQSTGITAGLLNVSTTNGGDIDLGAGTNAFKTLTVSTSGEASIFVKSGITIAGANVGGTFTLTSGGSMKQSGAIAAGDFNVTTSSGNITLTDATNAIGEVSLASAGSVTLYDSIDLLVDGATVVGDLAVLDTHNVGVTGSIQSTASDVLVVAGWDGVTTGSSLLTKASAYGNNGGSITVGGKNATGDVAIGSAGGITTLLGDDITLDAQNGYAQVGFNGGSAIGNIDVLATGNVLLNGANAFAQIGHGGANSIGSNSGNITVSAAGTVTLEGGSNFNAYAQIGHGGDGSNSDPSANFSQAGNISVVGTSVSLDGGAGSEAFAQIGNGGADTGNDPSVAITEVNSGDIEVIATDGSVALLSGAGNAYAQIGHGGAYSGIVFSDDSATPPTATNNGNITVSATGGSVTLTASGGGDPDDQSTYAQIGHGGVSSAGSASGDILITASGDIVLTGGNAQPNGLGLAYAQIGNGAGSNVPQTDSGNITLNVGGDLTLVGSQGLSDDSDYVQIGNGSVLNLTQTGYGPVSGDILINVAGTTTVQSANGAADVWIGNIAGSSGSESGAVTITTGDFDASADDNSDLGRFVGSDLSGGAVTVAITDAGSNTELGGLDYSSANALTLTTAGSAQIIGDLQNSGTGNVTLVADGDLTIGGTNATSNVAVGSAGGTTSITADNLLVSATNGYAQIGYHGAGTGNIEVATTGNVNLISASGNAFAAQIGNGGLDVASEVSGAVSVTTGGGSVNLDAAGDTAVAAIGNIGGAGESESGDIAVNTSGGAVSLVSSASGSYAQIGNWTDGSGAGIISGNVSIDAGAISLASTGSFSSAQIGNGNYLGFANTGAISGDIDINASSLTMTGTAPSGGFEEVRIGDLGEGGVSGNLTVTTTGDIALTQTGGGATSIGNFSNPHDTNGNETQGAASGNVIVQSGGGISVLSNGSGAYASIEIGGAASGAVNVNANGNVVLTTNDGAGALIGALVFGDGGANVTVTSQTGAVDVESTGNASFVQIGNIEALTSGDLSGDVTVSATVGDIIVAANSGSGNTSRVGNTGVSGGTVDGDLALTAGNAIEITNGAQSIIGNSGGSASGNVTLDAVSLSGDINPSIANDLLNGDFTLLLTGDDALTLASNADYASSHNLLIANGGDIAIDGSVQNAGSGNITLVSGSTITVGGAGASGSVAVGSQSGVTAIVSDNLLLSGLNGYAQIGYHGGGSGVIVVATSGDIMLTGGMKKAYFAQIGNGGYLVSGSSSGAVSVLAGGNITLNAGSGQEAYAQIGNGGAESNSNTSGYSETGLVTVSGETITLDAGSGTGSYAQIGHGGYKSGQSLNGIATIGGDILVNAVTAIRLVGGGEDAYAQIGNGGDFVNDGAANGSNGTTSGNISVLVATAKSGSNDPLTLTAGSGANSYSQIGNGGQGENTPVTGATVTFDISGDVTVADLTLTGSNTGANGYAQIGNGDASQTGTGNVSGLVTLGQGTEITTIPGTASGASAGLGNATGFGTVSGTLPGGGSDAGGGGTGGDGGNGIDAGVQGSVAAITQNPVGPTNFNITTVVVTPENTDSYIFDTQIVPQGPSPLEQLADESNSEGELTSDTVAQAVGQSLGDGKTIYVTSKTLIPGMLKQIVTLTRNNPNGVPPADEDYSSWGNEALWRW